MDGERPRGARTRPPVAQTRQVPSQPPGDHALADSGDPEGPATHRRMQVPLDEVRIRITNGEDLSEPDVASIQVRLHVRFLDALEPPAPHLVAVHETADDDCGVLRGKRQPAPRVVFVAPAEGDDFDLGPESRAPRSDRRGFAP